MKLIQTIGVLAVVSLTTISHAALVDFTGGTVTQFGGVTSTTDTLAIYDNVDFYEEDGIKFDFIGPSGEPFSYLVGDYYEVGNDVIHGHWASADLDDSFGDMESILVNKVNGASFDLNYLKITTNTIIGGGPANGNEEVFINALADGINVSFSMLLPPDDWGFDGPNTEIFFGSEFDNILAFSFTYGSGAVGLGLDEFFIDEEHPSVPVPTAVWLFGTGLIGLIGLRKKTLKVSILST